MPAFRLLSSHVAAFFAPAFEYAYALQYGFVLIAAPHFRQYANVRFSFQPSTLLPGWRTLSGCFFFFISISPLSLFRFSTFLQFSFTAIDFLSSLFHFQPYALLR